MKKEFIDQQSIDFLKAQIKDLERRNKLLKAKLKLAIQPIDLELKKVK